jgi:voltage-gated potassium channel
MFIIEYALRLWVAKNRVRHIFKLYSIIDLLAIIPGVIFARQAHFAVLRILRVLRVLRLIRFLETQDFFFGTITSLHLYIARVLFTLVTIPFTAAGFVYYAERLHPDTQIHTFFDAFYYSVVALTTVGFGDIVPLTTAGRSVTILMIAAGIVFIPWQVKDLIAHFVTTQKNNIDDAPCALDYHDSDAKFCKQCGTPLEV